MKILVLAMTLFLYSYPSFSEENNASNTANAASNAYDFSFSDADNNVVDLIKYKGKLILMVKYNNLCGFTRNLFNLDSLYKTYANRGFEIMLLASKDNIQKCRQKVKWITYKLLVNDKNNDFYKWVLSTSNNKKANQILISPFGDIIQTYTQEPSENISQIKNDIEYNLPEPHID